MWAAKLQHFFEITKFYRPTWQIIIPRKAFFVFFPYLCSENPTIHISIP